MDSINQQESLKKEISPKNSQEINYSKSNSNVEKEEKEEKDEPTKILPKKTGKELYDSYKRDLGISEFTMKRAIKSVGEWIVNVETQRNLQMKNDFDEEKEFKLEKQKEIQNQIEELSNDNESERMIVYFNEKIKQQETLFEKYSEIKNKIDTKIRLINNTMPNLENKVTKYKLELRKLNRENLKLMEQINKFENELSYRLSEELENYNYNNDEIPYSNISNSNIDTNNSNSISININNSQSINSINYSNMINNMNFAKINNKQLYRPESNNISTSYENSINIPEILEKNENLRKKKEKIDKMKEILEEKKKENEYLMKNINQMNNNFFKCKKVYNEGMHEIAKELLRINEMELDKVINNSNTNFNSLYFDIFKTNYNSGQSKNDLLRLPMINNNIQKKFKYPIIEKSQPNDLLYKVIKNIIEENNINNKINNMKKNKFSWDEFKDFSAYQIYTLLNINKDVLNKLDICIFPNQIFEKEEEK